MNPTAGYRCYVARIERFRPITDSLTWHAYAVAQIAAAPDAASKRGVRDMTTKSKLKLLQDNSVPAIADAIDNAIQHAIDLQRATNGEACIRGWDGGPLDEPSGDRTGV
jgi:hypothetical protein